MELHCFSDASEKAYAAVVYLRSPYEDGRIDVNLVASKTKAAPLKKQSIPRLELLGATILVRLVKAVQNALPQKLEPVYWVDSMTVLCWIKNVKPWNQYVMNRVQEIREHTAPELWKFCPGNQNPADNPSRGMTASELVTEKRWWKGPEFLYNQKENGWTTMTRARTTETPWRKSPGIPRLPRMLWSQIPKCSSLACTRS